MVAQPGDSVPYHGGMGLSEIYRDMQATRQPETPAASRLSHMPKLERIEGALRYLIPGAEIYVDTAGEVHRSKKPFLNGGRFALATFRAEESGVFTVYRGIPPRFNTYCQSGNNSADSHISPAGELPLQYSTTMRSGDIIRMGKDFSFTIPRTRCSEIKTGPDALSERVANASVGDFVPLGRSAAAGRVGIPSSVSRVHVTVEILSSTKGPDGKLDIRLRVFPGILGSEPIFLQRSAEDLEEVTGATRAASGATAVLGALGVVTLPHPENSLGDLADRLSVCFSRHDLKGADQLLNSIAPGVVVRPFSQAACREDRVPIGECELDLQLRALRVYITKGLHLIRDNKHEDAVEHFKKSGALETLGYRFEENHAYQLNVLTGDAVIDLVRRVASDSWFKINERVVYPSFGMLKEGLKPQSEAECELLRHFNKEVALLFAEEYTHALQDAKGGLVSRKAILLRGHQHEADVALFFAECGVGLSNDFWMARYPERREAMIRAHGLQSEEEAHMMTNLIKETPLGGSFMIGGDIQQAYPGTVGLSISNDPAPRLTDEENQVRRRARAELMPAEAKIIKCSDGSFAVCPAITGVVSHVYVPDEAGYYQPLERGRTLTPGTPIYLGRGFRFELT